MSTKVDKLHILSWLSARFRKARKEREDSPHDLGAVLSQQNASAVLADFVADFNVADSGPSAKEIAATLAKPKNWALSPPDKRHEMEMCEVITERDRREEVINQILDLVLGKDRPEWSSAYNFEDAIRDVQARCLDGEAMYGPPLAWVLYTATPALTPYGSPYSSKEEAFASAFRIPATIAWEVRPLYDILRKGEQDAAS